MPATNRSARAVRTILLLVAVLASSGCASMFRAQRLSPEQHWMIVRDSAIVAMDSGRYDAAGRMLANFQVQRARTPQAADAAYWRAMLLLDPRNGGGKPMTALAVLDSASMMSAFAERHAAIAVARRVARNLVDVNTRSEQLTQEIAKAREIAAGAQQHPAGERTAEPQRSNLAEEVQRLREELTKANAERDRANAELQRVRRRLTTPGRP